MYVSKTFNGSDWLKNHFPDQFSFYVGVCSSKDLTRGELYDGVETLLDYHYSFNEYRQVVNNNLVVLKERHGEPMGYVHINNKGLIRRLESPCRTRPVNYVEVNVLRK